MRRGGRDVPGIGAARGGAADRQQGLGHERPVAEVPGPPELDRGRILGRAILAEKILHVHAREPLAHRGHRDRDLGLGRRRRCQQHPLDIPARTWVG
jgi:hypothetical protein